MEDKNIRISEEIQFLLYIFKLGHPPVLTSIMQNVHLHHLKRYNEEFQSLLLRT